MDKHNCRGVEPSAHKYTPVKTHFSSQAGRRYGSWSWSPRIYISGKNSFTIFSFWELNNTLARINNVKPDSHHHTYPCDEAWFRCTAPLAWTSWGGNVCCWMAFPFPSYQRPSPALSPSSRKRPVTTPGRSTIRGTSSTRIRWDCRSEQNCLPSSKARKVSEKILTEKDEVDLLKFSLKSTNLCIFQEKPCLQALSGRLKKILHFVVQALSVVTMWTLVGEPELFRFFFNDYSSLTIQYYQFWGHSWNFLSLNL